MSHSGISRCQLGLFCSFCLLADGVTLSSHGQPSTAGPGSTDLEKACEGENRKDMVRSFRTAFDEMWRYHIKGDMSNITEPVFLLISEWHANPMLFNFIAHANETTRSGRFHMSIVNVALDARGHLGCQYLQNNLGADSRVKVRCIDLSAWLPPEIFTGSTAFKSKGEALELGRATGNAGFGTCKYNLILWTKPHIFMAAVEASPHAVLLIDSDVVIHGDLMGAVIARYSRANEDATAATRKTLVTGEERKRGRINTGTVYATKESLPILQRWVDADESAVVEAEGDQGVLQRLYEEDPYLMSHTVLLGGIVGQCGLRGKIATHFNCDPNKLKVLKREGQWHRTADEMRHLAKAYSQKGLTPEPYIRHVVAKKVRAMKQAGMWLGGQEEDA